MSIKGGGDPLSAKKMQVFVEGKKYSWNFEEKNKICIH